MAYTLEQLKQINTNANSTPQSRDEIANATINSLQNNYQKFFPEDKAGFANFGGNITSLRTKFNQYLNGTLDPAHDPNFKSYLAAVQNDLTGQGGAISTNAVERSSVDPNVPAAAAPIVPTLPNTGSAPVATPVVPTTQTPTLLQQGSGTSTAPDESVRAIQTQLGITADGIFGPQTKSAIMNFQQQNGLTVDGIVGPLTQAALQKAANATTTNNNSTGTGAGTSTGTSTTQKPPDDPSNKINSATGQPNPKWINPATGKTALQETEEINTAGNADQENLLAGFKTSLGTSVDVSNSSKILSAVTDALSNLSTPTPKSDVQTFNDQRAALGVGPLEDSKNSLQAEMDKLDANYKTTTDTETNRQVSVTQINRRKSAEQIAYEAAKNDLQNKINNVNNQLNQKYAIIDTMVKYTDQDNQTAQQNYTDQFNKIITTGNLLKGVADDQKSDQEKAIDNAQANVGVMINMLKAKQIDFSKLDASTRTDIANLEIQAGFPRGFIQTSLQALDKPVISYGTAYVDQNTGERMQPIYTKDPSTGLVTTNVVPIAEDQSVKDKKAGLDKLVKEDVAAAITYMKEHKQRGINPDEYNNYRKQIFDQYGAAGVTQFDNEIKSQKLIVDYGTASDAEFNKGNKVDPVTGIPLYLTGEE